MKLFSRDAFLCLEGDGEKVMKRPVEDYLEAWAGEDEGREAVKKAVLAVLEGAPLLAHRLLLGKLPGDPGALIGNNADGDKQKRIDVGAHKLFIDLLQKAGVAAILSEEEKLPIAGVSHGRVAVAIDPLDGSDNINIGAPVGTIFSIFPAAKEGGEHFLRFGHEQLSAGYICYGHTVDCAFSVGSGLVMATLNPDDGKFYITAENVRLPEETTMLAFNASVYCHVSAQMRAYIDDCWQGKDGVRGKNFNMRWLASLVGESQRIFSRGGLFFYINDNRKGYEKGRLRLIYEAFPIAFLCEEAGGLASNGVEPILQTMSKSYHERSPFIFGAAAEVKTLLSYKAGRCKD